MNNNISIYMPSELKLKIAKRAKALRLQKSLKRTSLSEISGVSASSIKRFETTGQVSFTSLLQIANALGVLNEFSSLFKTETPMTLAELEKLEHTPTPLRGRI